MVMRLVKRKKQFTFCLNFDFSYDYYFCNLKTQEFSFIKTKERIHSSSVKTLGQRAEAMFFTTLCRSNYDCGRRCTSVCQASGSLPRDPTALCV